MASKQSFRTSYGRYAPNFKFLLWNIQLLWYWLNNYSKWLLEAILNILDFESLAYLDKFIQTDEQTGFLMYMTKNISHKLNRFYAICLQYNSKWLLDAILNILIRAIFADFGRNTHIWDFNKKVYAKFHLCSMHFYHFMKKTIMGNDSRTPSWISHSQQDLELRAIDESPRTLIRRYMTNLRFILWNMQIFCRASVVLW